MYITHALSCSCEECVRIKGVWASERIAGELAEIRALLVRILEKFEGRA